MFGFSLGIVVQNNDPQKRGRVKVFIPHLSTNLLEDWDNKNTDKSFEKLSDDNIKVVIDKIKDRLPWANCAAPIFGEIGNHYYDSKEKESKSGDSFNKEEHKPSKDIEDNPPEDAFENKYEHTSYSNSAKGLFSIPRVGSRVWVFFENGNPNRPVYFATSYSKEDWGIIADDENYPSVTENVYESEDKPDGYKNKLAISQRGGIIEIINTDNKESIQISHYNGSFKIWTNGGTKEYVEGAERKLVSGSSFKTIKNSDNEVIEEDKNTSVIKNVNLTIGENFDILVEKDINININGKANITVKEDCTITSEKNVDIFSGEKIRLNP